MNQNSEYGRKRSRPSTKQNKIDIIKRNKLVFGIILLIVFIIVIAGAASYYLYAGQTAIKDTLIMGTNRLGGIMPGSSASLRLLWSRDNSIFGLSAGGF
jgi:hypothetical protein